MNKKKKKKSIPTNFYLSKTKKFFDFFLSVLEKKLYLQAKKHFGGAFVNVTHSTVHVPTIIYSLSTTMMTLNLDDLFISV